MAKKETKIMQIYRFYTENNEQVDIEAENFEEAIKIFTQMLT